MQFQEIFHVLQDQCAKPANQLTMTNFLVTVNILTFYCLFLLQFSTAESMLISEVSQKFLRCLHAPFNVSARKKIHVHCVKHCQLQNSFFINKLTTHFRWKKLFSIRLWQIKQCNQKKINKDGSLNCSMQTKPECNIQYHFLPVCYHYTLSLQAP